MSYDKLAKQIIEYVGGKENVRTVIHCVTRLRFQLVDESKANTGKLNKTDGVVTVRQSGGQYQVVIGNHVPEVYKAVVSEGGFSKQENSNETDQKAEQNFFNHFIDTLSSIFTPILFVLVAAGMIKGFNTLFVSMDWLDEASGTYEILNAVGDGLFYFLPFFLGYTAMNKFGGNPFLGMAIAAALVYPGLEVITDTAEPLYYLFEGSIIESPIYIEFFGIPIILMTYSMSVIPIIISTFFAAKLEINLNKVIPNVIKSFVVPMITMLIIIPLTFMIIGPISTWAAQLLGQSTISLYELNPVIAGVVIGGFWLVFVMFGLHWGLVPIAFNNIASHGVDMILVLMFAHSFALAGAILAVWLKTKNMKMKSISAPAFISSLFGVTEPGMYGIALPLKRPFYFTLLSSAIGGAMLGAFGTKGYVMGGLGLFQIPTFISSSGIDMTVIGGVISAMVAMVLAFILTFLFGVKLKDNAPVENEENKMNKKSFIMNSPLTGLAQDLSEVPDEAFSSKALGNGVAVKPEVGKLLAPVSGTVSVLFNTGHAIGITTDDGLELLIHIGIDTVQLNGQHFKAHVEQGDRVEENQFLIEFDIEAIHAAGYDTVTPIVVTNFDQYQSIEPVQLGDVQIGDPIISIES